MMIEGPDVGAGPEPTDAAPELSALLDDAAVDAAVRTRRAAREGRDRARELATWVGALRDLAERSATVQLHTTSDVAPTGDLISVAADHVVLRLHGGSITVVARTAITGLRVVAPDTGARAAAGDRTAPSDQALLAVLDRWREDGAPVHLVTRGGDSERGRLVTVGEDVVSLVTSAGTLHVPADAIVSVTVR